MPTKFSRAVLVLLITLIGWADITATAEPVTVKTVRVPDGGIFPQAEAARDGVIHLTYFKGDPKRGVVSALVSTNQGAEVASKGEIKRGDIVQYWYLGEDGTTLLGHTAVAVSDWDGGQKKVKLKGSQKNKVGEIESGFTKVIKLYIVRPAVP
jgi:hypothetical protein